MHFEWLQCILLAAILAAPLEVSARAIQRSDLTGDDAPLGNDILRRIEIPGIEIPKPIIPKPVIPDISNAGRTPGRTPDLAPDPSPQKPNGDPNKPNNNKPATDKSANDNSNTEQKPCKRADSVDCPSPGSQDLLLRTIAVPSFLNYREYMKPLGDDGKTFVGELPWKPDNDAIAEAHPYGLREFSDNFRTVTRNLWENLPASANNNANLVAAIFVPGKGVWFSSIPHDAGDTLIINDKASAPAWYARSEQVYNEVSGGRPPGGLHAEDGAIYQFEKSQGHAHSLSAQQAQEWRFPDGTRLAVYGKYDHEDPEGFKGPCRGGKSRWPGCMQLITRLNIIRST